MMTRRSKLGLVLAVGSIAALVGLARWGFTDSRERIAAAATNPAPSVSSAPMEVLMARIQGYSGDAMKVARLRSLLDQLSSSFQMSRDLVGDQTYVMQKRLAANGVAVDVIDIMEGINQLASIKTGGTYAEYLAYYTLLREKSFSHGDSMETLMALARDSNLRAEIMAKAYAK